MVQSILQIKWMKIGPFHNSKSRTDLGKNSVKNLLRSRLVRPMHKFAKLVTETINKV